MGLSAAYQEVHSVERLLAASMFSADFGSWHPPTAKIRTIFSFIARRYIALQDSSYAVIKIGEN